MSFHGKEICDNIDTKLVTGVWDKTDRDEPILQKPITSDNLQHLAEEVAISKSAGAMQKIKLAVEKLTGGAEEDAVRRVCQAVQKVSGALETVTTSRIDRLFVISSTGRQTGGDSDVDMVAFVENFEQALEAQLMQSVHNALRTVSENTPKEDGNCFTFDVNAVRVCLTLTHCVDKTIDGQRRMSYAKMSTLEANNALTDTELNKWSVACAESQLEFYQRFQKATNANYFFNLVRLLKLWQKRNLPRDVNPFTFEVIAFKVGESIINSGQSPDLLVAMRQALLFLSEPDKLQVHFDLFCPQMPAHLTSVRPLVTNPTNCYVNLAGSVKHWPMVKDFAIKSLNAIKDSTSTISDIFPSKHLKARGM